MPTLLRWRGDWYAWTGRDYAAFADDEMRARMYRFLNKAKMRSVSKGEDGEKVEDKPFNPDQRKVSGVIDALKSLVHYNDQLDAPSFRPSENSLLDVFGEAS